MRNKIEFTESAKKEIERVVSQNSAKTFFRITVDIFESFNFLAMLISFQYYYIEIYLI